MKRWSTSALIALVVASLMLAACGAPAWKANAAGPSKVTGPGTPLTRYGKPLELEGATLKTGDRAPAVTLKAPDGRQVKLSSFRGKIVLLSVVPIIDTPVCTSTTLHLNSRASQFGEDIVILVVSSDSPYEQRIWLEANDADRVVLLSDDLKYGGFGSAFGVRIKQRTILARSVFVIDRDGLIRHIEVVGENTYQPNLPAAIRMAERLRDEE